MTGRGIRQRHGFTIAELVTVIAIVGILASVALPVGRFALRRQKEIELRARLQKIAWAIDVYADLRSRGVVKGQTDVAGTRYPKHLDDLTKPLELIDGKKMTLLRDRDLVDPITGRSEWDTKSSTDDADSVSTNSDDVFDIHSTSHALSLDGRTHYNEW